MSRRTMRKRLAREYGISPKESRILLRKCGYYYDLAVYMLTLEKTNSNLDGVSYSFRKLGEVARETSETLYEALGRLGEVFFETVTETVYALNETISEVLTK